jgi:hypothetical protein
MKRTVLIALATVSAIGMATPSFAQGSLERDNNGGRGGPVMGNGQQGAQEQGGAMREGTVGRRQQDNLPSPQAQSPGAPNNKRTGPTDGAGNLPSENR